MKTSWTIQANKLFNKGTVICTKEPTWLSVVGWFIEHVIGSMCILFHWIPILFGDRIYKISDGEKFTLTEYYGDCGDLYHVFIYTPLQSWVWFHPSRKETYIELSYGKLKELFYDQYSEFFDEQDSMVDDKLESLQQNCLYGKDREFDIEAIRQAHCCQSCFAKADKDKIGPLQSMMIVCPICGNKRCAKASDHTMQCTNSNTPN